MVNIYRYYKKLISDMLLHIAQPEDIYIEQPKDKQFGDLSVNIAMVLAKRLGKQPRTIASEIVDILGNNPQFEDLQVAGPGFINWKMPESLIKEHVVLILNDKYSKIDIGNGQKINVEYVSANPTGPLHAGHARGAVVGDALARLMNFAGYDIVKEYYINDAGVQIQNLAKSVYFRYRQLLEKASFSEQMADYMYPGEYLIDVAQDIINEYSDKFLTLSEEEYLEFFRSYTTDKMMCLIKEDLNLLGIHHEVFTSEKELITTGKVDAALKCLEEKGYIYKGTLPPPKGKEIDDWEDREQVLFKSTDFGDDTDRPLMKADGSWTYFATDIAYHMDKFNRGCEYMVDFWGADHGGYVKRMVSAAEAITGKKDVLSVKICQLVRFMDNGTEFKMSKRAGTFITVRDILDRVGKDVIRFYMLTRKDDATLDFDFKKVVEQSKENPVFYVQYALARTYSVIKQFKEIFAVDELPEVNSPPETLNDDELTLCKTMMQWPRQIELAVNHREPHRIAFYLWSLAADFHSLWNVGKASQTSRFINKDNYCYSLGKLALILSVQKILELGLDIIGVTPVKELR